MDYKEVYIREKKKNDSLQKLYKQLLAERNDLQAANDAIQEQIAKIQNKYYSCNSELSNAVRELREERAEYEKLKKELMLMMNKVKYLKDTLSLQLK